MPSKIKGSLLLSSVEAFVAVAAFNNAKAASRILPEHATTLQRRINKLEDWLSRILLIPGKDLELSDDGVIFVDIALEIVDLVDIDLKNELSKRRVHPDGSITIAGMVYNTINSQKIAKKLLAFRADVESSVPYVKVDPALIDMSWFTPNKKNF